MGPMWAHVDPQWSRAGPTKHARTIQKFAFSFLGTRSKATLFKGKIMKKAMQGDGTTLALSKEDIILIGWKSLSIHERANVFVHLQYCAFAVLYEYHPSYRNSSQRLLVERADRAAAAPMHIRATHCGATAPAPRFA